MSGFPASSAFNIGSDQAKNSNGSMTGSAFSLPDTSVFGQTTSSFGNGASGSGWWNNNSNSNNNNQPKNDQRRNKPNSRRGQSNKNSNKPGGAFSSVNHFQQGQTGNGAFQKPQQWGQKQQPQGSFGQNSSAFGNPFQSNQSSPSPSSNQNSTSRKKKPWKQRPTLTNTTESLTPPGFQTRNHPPRPTPTFLLPGQTSKFESNTTGDEWDQQNQQKMLQVEQSSSNMQTLYETLQTMRDVERKEMENRGLVDEQDVRKDLKDAIAFTGSCQYMCPVFERIRRTFENNVKKLEKDPVTGKVTQEFAVKAFSRPAAGQPPPLPSDVRPPHVLKSTLEYLIDTAIPTLPHSHSFLWDRTRSVRQDFTYQNYAGDEAVDCNEAIARIHVVCLHVMAGSGLEYSKQQEVEQFNKTLQTLSELYSERRKHGFADSVREPEMRAYQLLIRLRDPDVERQIQKLPQHIIDDHQVQMALKLRSLIQQNGPGVRNSENVCNFFTMFFQQLENAPFLINCLCESHFNEIRLLALKSLGKACHAKARPYATDRLRDMLAFDTNDEAIRFCEHYQLPCNEDGVQIAAYSDSVVMEQSPLAAPFSKRVDAKLNGRDLTDVVRDGDTGAPVLLPHASQPVNKPEPQNFAGVFGNQKQQPALNAFGTQPQPKSQPNFNLGGQQNVVFGSAGLFGKSANQSPTFGTGGTESQPGSSAMFGGGTSLAAAAAPQSQSQSQSQPQPQQQPQEQKKQAEPAPAPPPPVPPKPQIELTDSDVETVLGRLLKDTTPELVRQVVPESWKLVRHQREQQKQAVIAKQAENVLQQMTNEIVHVEMLKAMAKDRDMIRLVKKYMKRIQQTAIESKEKYDRKRRLSAEMSNVYKQLGRSNSHQRLKRRKSSAPATVDDQLRAVASGQQSAQEMWTMIDYKRLMIPHIQQAFRDRGMFDRKYVAAVFCEDWSSTSGHWMRVKLGMELVKEPVVVYEGYQELNHTSVSFRSLIDYPPFFAKCAGIVFECGVQDIDTDCERLAEIYQRIDSQYEMQTVVVYYGDLDGQEVLPRLNAPNAILCRINNVENATQNMSSALVKLAQSFSVQLSKLGQDQRREVAHERDLAAERRREQEQQQQLAKQQAVEDGKYRELNRYKFLRGNFVKPPVRKRTVSSMSPSTPPQHTVSGNGYESSAKKKRLVMPKQLSTLDQLVSGVLDSKPQA